jgi:hypothetical protein
MERKIFIKEPTRLPDTTPIDFLMDCLKRILFTWRGSFFQNVER